jgi:hypothetical protein
LGLSERQPIEFDEAIVGGFKLNASVKAFVKFAMKCVNAASRIGGLCLVMGLMAFSTFAGLVPVGLQCESKNNPLGLSEPSPRLSWHDTATVTDERGQYQTAYRIQVASSLEALTNNQGDLWDTGQVPTNQTSQIVYAGNALASHQVCYWRVQVWDKIGQPSGWSSPATWTMGVLTQGEWTAQWIGRDDGPAWNTGSTFFKANCDRPRISGDKLVLTGHDGKPGAGYTLLTTTNFSAPIKWITNRTGSLDAAGAFSNVIPIDPAQPANFYRIRTP